MPVFSQSSGQPLHPLVLSCSEDYLTNLAGDIGSLALLLWDWLEVGTAYSTQLRVY